MIDEKALEVAGNGLLRGIMGNIEADVLVFGLTKTEREHLAQAAVEAYLGALEGFVLAPVEPTARDMMLADMDASSAMLAAARPQIEGE